MSEQINKVLASTAQSFTTAEQKQARDNIGAMAASASSLYYSTSNPSAFISGVKHDGNMSGSGTDASPLCLNTSITLAKNGESATLAYDHLTLTDSNNDPIISAANGDIYMSAHAGNASSPYTANYGVQGMHVYGTDTYNHITATATLRYSGGTFVEGDDSAKIKATGLTLHTTADGDQLVDASSVVRWNSYSSISSFTGCSAGNNISGNGTSASPLGLNSSIVFTTSNRQNTIQSDKMELTGKTNPLVFSGTYRPWGWDISGSATSTTGVTNPQTAIVQSTSYFSMYNTSDDNEKAQGYFTFRGAGFGESGTGGAGNERHTNISIEGITSISGYPGTASSHTGFYLTNGADANHDLELKFESGSTTAKVDIPSIQKWNSLKQGLVEEIDPLGLGGESAVSANTYYTGYNWSVRTVSASGLPETVMYGFASVPQNTGVYGFNSAGGYSLLSDLYVPFQTSDSNLYARITACTAAGRCPVLVGPNGQLMGNLIQTPNETQAVFSKILSNAGTHLSYYVKSDGTISSAQIRGFDGASPYGTIHRTRLGSNYTQQTANDYVWSTKGYCTGNWLWNDGSNASYNLREISTGNAGHIDVFHYHWSFMVCHSTEDTMSTSTVGYFEVAPMIETWSTGGNYSTAWAPFGSYTIVPVSGYESSVNQSVTSYHSKWEKLELDYMVPKVIIKSWIDNTALYSDAIVSPRVKLMNINTTGAYHSLGIRMGTESVSFLNHM